jgi:hypothetical protein
MGFFSYLASIYQLDTLDTRFTNSTTIPYQPSQKLEKFSSGKTQDPAIQYVPPRLEANGQPRAQPSKWRTPEFYFYYFCFITIVPYMFWVPYTVSRR